MVEKRELIMLGTGCAMVTQCYNTCFLIKINDDYIMTDAGGGNGILRQMEQAGVDYTKLHHMFVTHGHSDHIFGVIWIIRKIAALMDAGKYAGEFHIYCHDIVASMIGMICGMVLKRSHLAHLGTGILIHVVEDGQEIHFLDVTMTPFDIHSTKAKQFGYELRFADGLRLTCLGDEPYDNHCRPYAAGSDWLLSEAFCQYKDRDTFKPYEKHHSTVKEACETAEKLGVKNLVLYHTEDKTITHRKENYTKEGKDYFHGNLYVPEDGEGMELGVRS